ncbi:MAG TPA: adenylate/guanylate cyclase domain-containing protein [Actinomycetota bacterium]
MPACPNCGQENPDAANFCLNCGTPFRSGAGPREFRKTVTVVFCDIAESTDLAERLDPESLRRVMTRYFDEMKAALERHGGTVQKFIGDAVMAVFGIPAVHEDDALRALRAATEMRERLDRLNESLDRDHGVRLVNRTGVNTGEVVAGGRDAGQSLVIGDAVNIAARLEQAAAPGEILVGEPTYRLTRDALRVEPLDPLALKGKAHPVKAFRLIDIAAIPASATRRLISPMVGRRRQLSALHDAFEDAVTDQACHLFTVLGSAGVGKSRLVREFVQAVEQRAITLQGRCLPYGEGITFWPVREFVQAAAGIIDTDPPAEALQKLAKLVADEDDRDLIAEHVGQAIGLAEATAPSEEIFWAVRKLLESQARDRPLVVVIDDIHWAEPTMLDLIEHVADWSRGASILLVCVGRQEFVESRPSWGGGKLHATSILLEPLNEDESDELVENLLGHANLRPAERARISEAAGGNPLFVEEMIGMLIDDGLLRRENDHWAPAGDLTNVSVPPTIQALLAARLDRLEFEERQVIERAAVVGKIFYRGAVVELSPDEIQPRVGAHLMTLARKELIRPARSGFRHEEAYQFRHLLVRDAAYHGMPKEIRADLHEAFAAWLERTAGARANEYEEIVGYHLEQAHGYRVELGPVDERARAIALRAAEHLGAAGRRALNRYDFTAAASLLTRATALLPDDSSDRLELLVDLGVAATELGDFPTARAALGEAIARARASGNRAIEYRARTTSFDRSHVEADPGDAGDPVAEAHEAIRALEENPDDLALSRAWQLIGYEHWLHGEATQAEPAFSRALEHARRASSPRDASNMVSLLGATLVYGPMPAAEALQRTDELLAQASGDRRAEGTLRLAKAIFLAMLGRFEEARASASEARRILEDLGPSVTSTMVMSSRSGLVEELAGDLERAEELERRGYEELKRWGEKTRFSTLAAQLADHVFQQGRYDEAEALANESRQAAQQDDIASQSMWRSVMAKVLARRGDFDQAERLAREAVDLRQGIDFVQNTAQVWESLGEVFRMAGRTQDAVEALGQALKLHERKGNVVAANRVRALLSETGGNQSTDDEEADETRRSR